MAKLATSITDRRYKIQTFVAIRKAGTATVMKEMYSQLQERDEYKTLCKWKNKDDGLAALTEWEAANPGICSREPDDGQFFGFKQVAQGYLGRFTRYLYIPAVREAATDASEGKGSTITQLMDLVVRSGAEQGGFQGISRNCRRAL